MFKYAIIITGLLGSVTVSAQEYGALVGFHQTEAEFKTSSDADVDGKMGFKAGLAVAFELADKTHFRTGAIFAQRHVELKTGAGVGYAKVLFDYIDVPVNVQYHLTDKFGVYGGVTVGVNVNDKIDYSEGITSRPDPDAEKMIPLLNAGVNLLFDDMIGFDFYYERGLGDISDGLKDYSTFGLNFLYWF